MKLNLNSIFEVQLSRYMEDIEGYQKGKKIKCELQKLDLILFHSELFKLCSKLYHLINFLLLY